MMPTRDSLDSWCPPVLVVDPQMTRRIRVTTWFHDHGFPVASVTSGMDALVELRESPVATRPRLVAASAGLPDLAPQDLVQGLRSIPGLGEIECLFYAETDLERAAGASSPMVPVGSPLRSTVLIDDLEDAVRTLVERLRNLRRLERARETLTR